MMAGAVPAGTAGAAGIPTAITIATASPPPTLDPYFTTTEASLEISIEVFNTLAAYNSSFQLEPQLATSWSSSHNYTDWTLNLAHGIKFQNGQTMTSADVVASLERFQKVGALNEFMSNITAITAKGPYTVDITLKQPDAVLINQLANPLTLIAIMPAKYARIDKPLPWNELIGTGPYMYASVKPGVSVTLKRFDGYTPASHAPASGLAGDQVAHIQQLTFQYVPSSATRLAGLESGTFQYAESVPYAAYTSILHNPAVKPAINKYFFDILFQVNEKTPPLNNRYMREGIDRVLNESAIMQVVTNGVKAFYHLNPSIIYPQEKLWWSAAGSSGYDHPNVKAAKALFKKAGYHGQPIVILSNTTYGWMYKTTIVVERELKQAGVNVKLDVSDWPAEVARAHSGSSQGWNLMITGWSPYTDPADYSAGLSTGGALDFGFSSKKMDALLAAGVSTSNTAARVKIYREVQKLFYRDLPEIPIGNLYGLDAYASSLKGFYPWYLPRFWNVS